MEVAKTEVEQRAVRPAVLGVEDAARYIGCRRTHMFQLIREGLVPSFKLGRLRRIRVADLDRFVEERLTEEQASKDE